MFEFHIVSLDNKQWLFEAASVEERDEWVSAIEQQILNSLQVSLPHASFCPVRRETVKNVTAISPGQRNQQGPKQLSCRPADHEDNQDGHSRKPEVRRL